MSSGTAAGINIGVGDSIIASTDFGDAGFSSMRDTAAVVNLGHRKNSGAVTDPFGDRMAGGALGVAFSQAELNEQQMMAAHIIGREALNGLPLINRMRGLR